MFAHVTKKKYEPLYGNRLLCFLLVSSLFIQVTNQLLQAVDRDEEEIREFLRISVALILFTVIVSFIHFIVNVINEMADALRIPVFTVRRRNSQHNQSSN